MSGYGIDALSLFSGVDGWSQYDEELGIETTSLEKDDAAHATAVVAHKTNACQIDVTEYNLSPDHPYQLLEASPPCTKFTVAGNGEGRKLMEDILFRLEALRVHDTFITGSPFGRRVAGWKEASLVLEPARLIREAFKVGYPFESIAMEQTREVLPIWQAYGRWLEALGYSVATGVLNAEQYGVPQTRRRAVLIASRVKSVSLPEPTHAPFKPKLDSGSHRWVSMYRALTDSGLGMPMMFGSLRSNYGTGGDASKRGVRTIYQPAPTVTRKYNRNKWLDWREHPVAAMTDEQAAVLQTFPADYPWQGNKTEVQLQIGNAMPPLLAKAILQAVL